MLPRLFDSMAKKITALQVQKRHPDRVNVYLDGEFAFGLYRVVAAWLTVGQELSEEKIQQLLAAEAEEKAYQRALNFLSYRVRSEAEVRQNLKKHDTPEAVIEAVIERLRRNHLLDDVAFARAWVENRNTFRPRGRRALRHELRQKGVAEDVIAEALESLDENALALQAARKKARSLKRHDYPTFRQKMLGFLSRRGFPYEVCAAAVEQVWAEQNPAGESNR